jgi:hypothetical protein
MRFRSDDFGFFSPQETQSGRAATQTRNISRKDAKAAKKMNKIVFRTWRSSRLGERNIRKRITRSAQFFSTLAQTHQLGSMTFHLSLRTISTIAVQSSQSFLTNIPDSFSQRAPRPGG